MKPSDAVRTITSVEALSPSTLALLWSDGTRAKVNLAGHLKGRALRSLRDTKEFARARLGEWGHSVEWPGGAELGAQTLWLETLSANGHGDTRSFLEWRLRHGLSLSQTAEALGLSRRMIAYYSNGGKPVPRAVLLACKGWEVDAAA